MQKVTNFSVNINNFNFNFFFFVFFLQVQKINIKLCVVPDLKSMTNNTWTNDSDKKKHFSTDWDYNSSVRWFLWIIESIQIKKNYIEWVNWNEETEKGLEA